MAIPEVPKPEQAVPQTLGSGMTDTTDQEENALFGENDVVAFDREDGEGAGQPVAPKPDLAEAAQPVQPVAPMQQVAEPVPQVAPPAVPAPAVPAGSSPLAAPVSASVQVPGTPPEVPAPPPAVPGQPPAVAAPQQAAPVVPEQQAPQQAQQPAGFAEMSQQLQAAKTQVVDLLAQQSYGLTQEEADSLATDPVTVIPKMMARVHVNAVSAVLSHVAQQLPGVILGVMQQRDVNKRNEDQFFSAWPQLDRSKHGQAVASIARVYRQMNPNADADTFIKQVGAQAVVALGLLQPGGQIAPASAAAPASRQPPFVPAAVSAPVAGGTPAAANPFEVLGQLMLADDS